MISAAHNAADVLGQGTLVVERDEVAYANQALLRMSGYALDELRAMPSYLDLFDASFQRDALRRLLQQTSGLTVPAHDEGVLLRKDGGKVPVEVAIVKVDPEEDEHLMDAAVPRLVVIVRDVTREKEAQKELRRVVETLPDGVYVTDERGRITFANREAERILGLERSRIAGRTYKDAAWDAATPAGERIPEERHPAARALHDGETIYDAPLSVVNVKTRERIRLRVSAAPLRDEEGRLVGSVVSFNESRRPEP